MGLGGGTLQRGAHGIAVVLDDVDDRQLPQLGHVEGLINLPLIGRALAEEGGADLAIVAIGIGEGQTGADGHLGADDAVAAIERLLGGEHVHGAALAARITALAAGQLGHHALGVHVLGQHVAVVAVAGDDLVAVLQRHLDAGDDCFLTDIEVAETADQPHAVHLAGAFLETADEEHVLIGLEGFVLRQGGVAALDLVPGGLGGVFAVRAIACGAGRSGLLRSRLAAGLATGLGG